MKAKKLRFGCCPRLAMLRNSSSMSLDALFLRASAAPSACSSSPPSTSFSSVAVSPDCELCASSTITAQRRVGRRPSPVSPRSSASFSSCRETNGNFCSVVMMIGTRVLQRLAPVACESSSIFSTTPCLCSNW